MKIATKKIASGKLAQSLLREGLSVTLPFQDRSKSRLKVELSNGQSLAISLARGAVMRNRDVLICEDGSYVEVIAANENVMRVTASSPLELLRAAYHLGNRHTPVEIGSDYLHLESDPVLNEMLILLGVFVEACSRPFEPEHGAYGGGHKHGHDATFEEDYQLAQAAYVAHDHHHSHCGDGHHEH
jgi:urease accessory protein